MKYDCEQAECELCLGNRANCRVCQDNTYAFHGACFATCPSTTWQNNGSCQYCQDERCGVCLNEGKDCQACEKHYNLRNGSCVLDILDNSKGNNSTNLVKNITKSVSFQNSTDVLILPADPSNDRFWVTSYCMMTLAFVFLLRVSKTMSFDLSVTLISIWSVIEIPCLIYLTLYLKHGLVDLSIVLAIGCLILTVLAHAIWSYRLKGAVQTVQQKRGLRLLWLVSILTNHKVIWFRILRRNPEDRYSANESTCLGKAVMSEAVVHLLLVVAVITITAVRANPFYDDFYLYELGLYLSCMLALLVCSYARLRRHRQNTKESEPGEQQDVSALPNSGLVRVTYFAYPSNELFTLGRTGRLSYDRRISSVC